MCLSFKLKYYFLSVSKKCLKLGNLIIILVFMVIVKVSRLV